MTPLNSTYDDVHVGDVAPQFSEGLEIGSSSGGSRSATVRRRENPPATYQLRSLAISARRSFAFSGTG